MPFYRFPSLNNAVVHMRGTKLPAPCGAIAWFDGKQARCMVFSEFLCDWPDAEGRICDKALCPAHARQVGANRHYCPAHFSDDQQAQPQGSLFTHLVKS